jgi:hypothetical protein
MIGATPFFAPVYSEPRQQQFSKGMSIGTDSQSFSSDRGQKTVSIAQTVTLFSVNKPNVFNHFFRYKAVPKRPARKRESTSRRDFITVIVGVSRFGRTKNDSTFVYGAYLRH